MTKNISRSSVYLVIFAIIFAASLYLKLLPVLNYNFPFTMDQARDMLDIRAMVELKKPALIGPTTSINGVFLGPFYYYFNLIPYLVSGGNPAALTYWNIAWYMIAGITFFVFFHKKNLSFGFLSAAVFLMAPEFFYSSRYFWSANPMPYITAFYFISIINFLRKPQITSAAFVGLIAGLAMQFEAAFGILFLPFFIIFAAIKKLGIKNILASILAFLITLLPQAFFELRHNFIMTKTFLGEVGGKSQILGEKLTLIERFQNHLQSFIDFSGGILQIPQTVSLIIMLIAVISLCALYYHKKIKDEERNIFVLSMSFILFAFGFYMIYSFPLKGWYLLGLRIPYLLLITIFLNQIIKQKFPIFEYSVFILLGLSFFLTYSNQLKFIPKTSDRSTDKSNLRNEIEAIDWVYAKANTQGFKAYNYIPSVYDFPYQYLYWWHGGQKYGYHPEVLTYLDNVPEYIKDNGKFLTLKRPGENGNVFLIYEPDQESKERLFAWLGNFTAFCTIEKQTFSWGTTVEHRKPCPN